MNFYFREQKMFVVAKLGP